MGRAVNFHIMWLEVPISTKRSFEEKVRKTDSCWLFTGAKNRYGYGWFKEVNAHRCAWIIYKGEIPKNMFVLHKCDTPSCVNPDHLFLGTQADNLADMDRKGRRGTYDKRGEGNSRARLTNEDVLAIRISKADPKIIAHQYAICVKHVSHIRARRSWKHV